MVSLVKIKKIARPSLRPVHKPVKVFGPDLNVIQQLAIDVEKALRDVPSVADLYAERVTGKPYMEFQIKREEIARYGVNVKDVQDVIER